MRKLIALLVVILCPVIQAQKVERSCVGPPEGRARGAGAKGLLRDVPSRPAFQPGFEAPGGPPRGLGGVLNVKDFGAKGDSRSANDAQVFAGQNLITSNSLNFTATDVGKAIWAVNGTTPFGISSMPGGAASLGTVTTIASVISPTAATITGFWVAWPSYTGTPSTAVIGHDDTPGIIAAINAFLAQRAFRSCVFIPPGFYMVRGNLANTTANQTLCLYGSSVVTTTLFLSPDLPYNNPAGFGALLNLNGGVSMGGFNVEGGTIVFNISNQYLINLSGSNALVSDLQLQNWNGEGPGNAAVYVGGDYARLNSLRVQLNAATSMVVNANFLQCFSCVLSSYTAAIEIMRGQNLSFTGGGFQGLGTGLGVHISGVAGSVQNGSIVGAGIDGGQGQAQVVVESQSGQGTQFSFIADGLLGSAPNSTGIAINNCSNCTVTAAVSGSAVNSNGAGVAVNNAGTFIDGGGNQIVGAQTGPGTFLKQCP